MLIAWSSALCCLKGRVAAWRLGLSPRPAVPQAGFGMDLNNCQQGCAPPSPQACSLSARDTFSILSFCSLRHLGYCDSTQKLTGRLRVQGEMGLGKPQVKTWEGGWKSHPAKMGLTLHLQGALVMEGALPLGRCVPIARCQCWPSPPQTLTSASLHCHFSHLPPSLASASNPSAPRVFPWSLRSVSNSLRPMD